MKNKVVSHYNMIRSAFFLVLPLLVSVFVFARIVVEIRSYMEYQVTVQAASLGEMASRRLTEQVDNLEQLARYFKDGNVAEGNMEATSERMLEAVDQISDGILRLDGTPVFGDPLYDSEYSAIQNAFRGKSTVLYRDGAGFLFVVPVYNGSNIKYAYYEFLSVEDLFDSFGTNCYGGQVEAVLIDYAQDTSVMLAGGGDEETSFFRDGEAVGAQFLELSKKMGSSVSAATYYKSGGQDGFLFLAETEHENLYLMGTIPYKAVAQNVSYLPPLLLLVFCLLLVLLFIGTFSLFSANEKARESDELREAKRIADEASKSKSTFLANMSHELRTPINVILGMDELILREDSGKYTRERAMDIKSSAQILLGLINDVLDFSKIEAGNLNIIPADYDFVALIRDMVLLCENRARQKSLNFVLDVQPDLPIGLRGDDIHIRQIMINLLTNAVKYTPKGSVTLKLSGRRKEGNRIIIRCEVVDTGIGIKQEDIEKIIIPYSRVEERRNRNVEGTGLGLPIVTNLLKLMGSELQVDSVYGEGSTFYFELEQEIIDDEPIGEIQKRLLDMVKDYEYKAAFAAPKAKILMVDDNSMNRKLFVSLLKQTQIPVTTVSSGAKCLDIVKKEHFDIIFMDYLMPEMDGEETLHQLRVMEESLCARTPVIALTANAFNGAKEKYMSMGFDGFLAKPIVTEQLEGVIRDFLPQEYIEEVPEEGLDIETGSGVGEKVLSIKNKPEQELPAVEGINWEFVKLHVRDRELLMQSIQDFYKGIDAEYRDISALAEEIETEEGIKNYRIRVHALKSTAAFVGILSVSELAKYLEFAARNGEIEKIRRVHPALMEELLKAKENLAPVAERSEEKKELSDDSQLHDLFEMLLFSMDQMDIGGTDAVMSQMKAYYYSPDLEAVIGRLDEKVTVLDFEGAKEEVEKALALLDQRGGE